jgi:hypothetical protein
MFGSYKLAPSVGSDVCFFYVIENFAELPWHIEMSTYTVMFRISELPLKY